MTTAESAERTTGEGGSRPGLLGVVGNVFRVVGNVLRGRQASLRRLAADIELVRTELAVREPTDETPWFAGASAQLVAAEAALARGSPEVGWSNLLQARRLLLHGSDETSPEGRIELRSRATAIRAEAEEKLDGWRLEAVRDLLPRSVEIAKSDGESTTELAGKPAAESTTEPTAESVANTADGDESVPPAAAIYAAAEILDGRHGNVHRRVALVRKQVLALGLIEIVGVLGFLAVATFWESPFAATPGSAPLLVAVGLFGLMGASVGRLVALVGAASPEKLPTVAINWWTTIGRTLMGAAAALALYAFLHSGVVAIGGIDATSTDFQALVLAVSFAAGFSERLLERAIDAVGGAERPDSNPPDRRSDEPRPVPTDERDGANEN